MEFAGETYYFCSHDCLHAFEADPQRQIDGATTEREVTHAQ